jgi:Leucine-rich repeat (LRR) protein
MNHESVPKEEEDHIAHDKRAKAPRIDDSSASCDENHQELVRVQIDSKWENRTASPPGRKPGIASWHTCIGTEALLTGVFNSDPTSVDTLFEQQPTCFQDSGEEWSAPSDNAIPSAGVAASPGAYRIQPGRPTRLARDSTHDNTWLPGDEIEETPSQPQSSSNGPLERIMLDATLAPSELTLPKATEVIPANLSASAFRRRAFWFIIILSAAVVISIAAGSVVASKNRDRIDAEDRRVSFVEFRDSFLPVDSLQRAIADPLSPQGSALKWLQNDVREAEVVAWRMLQRYSLAVVFFALNGSTWGTNTGWLTSMDDCQWTMITESASAPAPCDEDGRFLNLSVFENNATGSLPHEIGFLRNLVSLELSFNMISGTIPTSVGFLSQLKSFSLKGNNLGGKIPSEVGLVVGLTWLDLSRNQLAGQIPLEVGRLSRLATLLLDHNPLSGSLPTEVGLLTNLANWYVEVTSVGGAIPTEVGLMTSLVSILLDRNKLTGTMPTEVGHLVRLGQIDVTSNHLSGGIPPQLCVIPSLDFLSLGRNNITGTIPPELYVSVIEAGITCACSLVMRALPSNHVYPFYFGNWLVKWQ